MRSTRPILAIAALFHVLAAILTPGFFHPDEHYQTIEWANALLGRTDVSQLTWEYRAQARSWLQPMVYAAIAYVGPDDPFTLALLFRLVSGAIGFLGLAALAACIPKWFDDEGEQKIALIALATFYFLPIFHARTSSENLAGSMMMIAVWCLTTSRGYFAGLALGAAFLFRYQAGFMILGALIHSPRRRIFLGLGAALIFGIFLDRLGYGEWVLAPLRYFQVNIIEDKAGEFGRSPPWQYIGWLWHDLLKPFGGMVVLALIAVAIRRPKHLLTAICVPFFLAHALIPHKEARFLYPLLDFAPVLMVLAVSPYLSNERARPWLRLRNAVLAILFALNAWALLTMGFHPPLFAGAWLRAADPQLPLQYTGRPPYGEGLSPTFYRAPRATKEPPTGHDRLVATDGTASPARDPKTGPHLHHHDGPAPRDPPPSCTSLVREPPIARWLPVENKTARAVFGVRQVVDLYVCP